MSGDLTLYAVWKHNPSVSYDANGGYFTTSMPIDYPEVNKAYTVSGSVPTREGCTFTGWNTKPDGSGTSPAAGALQITDYNDITLYAQWEVINYQITVIADEGVTVSDGLEGGLPYGSDRPFEVSGTGTIRVYANGVLLSPQRDGKYHVTVTQDIEIVITRTEPAEQYIVSYDPNGGHDAPRDESAYPSGSSTNVLGQGGMFRTGWTFTGWNTQRDGSGTGYAAGDPLTVSADTVLYAQWRANRYTVEYDANGGSGTMDAARLDYGTAGTISPCAFTREGYRFAGWARSTGGFPVYRGGENVLNLTEEDGGIITLYALWTAEEYTLTLDAMGGAPAKSCAKAAYDAPLPSITLPTRTGYVFDGFFDGNGVRYYNADGTAAVGAWDKAGDAALTAHWIPIDYQVKYNANASDAAGTMENSFMTYDNGGALAPNAFTRAGRTFLGWALTPGGGVVYEDGASVQNLASAQGAVVTLYAVWSAKRTYQITYDAGTADTVLNLPAGGEKVHGEPYAVSALSPVRTGYDFTGWLGSDGSAYQPGDPYDADAALTLTAQWEAKTYTLTLNNNGVGTIAVQRGGSPLTGSDIRYGDVLDITVKPRAGYTTASFWCMVNGNSVTGGADEITARLTVTGDVTVTLLPRGTEVRYTVKYHPNGGTGTIPDQAVISTASASLSKGGDFRMEHAALVGWNTAADGSGTGYALGAALTAPLAPDGGEITLYAVWRMEDKYSVRYDANGGVGGPTDRDSHYRGASVPVLFTERPTREGYTFLGWSTDRNSSIPAYTSDGDTLTMGSENVTLYAVWQQNAATYTVRYDANGGTGVPTDEGAYPAGTDVDVRFSPLPTRPGWSFLGWARSSTAARPEFTTQSHTLTMGSGNVVLYAVWQQVLTFTITYDANAGGDLVTALPGAGSKTAGADYTVSPTVPARGGYTFLGWSSTPGGAAEFAPGDVYSGDADLTLYAVWERVTYTVTTDGGGVSNVTLTAGGSSFPSGTAVEFTVAATGTNVLGSLTVAVNGSVMQMTEENGVLTGSFVLERDSTITVRSGAQTYDVVYDANGGAPAGGETRTYVTGTTLVLHDGAGFSKAGYHITGWNTADDGSGAAYGLAQVLTSDLAAGTTLYAVWEADPDARGYSYTVTYDPNDGAGTARTQTLYQNELTTELFTLADVPDFARDGYTLIGWTTVQGGTVVSYALGSRLTAPLAAAGQSVTLYAVWQLDEITVTLSDPQKVCTVPSISVRLGGSYGALPALMKEGWTFSGWYNERGEKIESTTLVTNGAPHTLYARWTSNSVGPVAPREPDKINGYDVSYTICPRDRTCPAYPFTDLNLKLWYHDGIHFCVENGLMQGVPGGLFDPDGTTTRAQAAAMIMRFLVDIKK